MSSKNGTDRYLVYLLNALYTIMVLAISVCFIFIFINYTYRYSIPIAMVMIVLVVIIINILYHYYKKNKKEELDIEHKIFQEIIFLIESKRNDGNIKYDRLANETKEIESDIKKIKSMSPKIETGIQVLINIAINKENANPNSKDSNGASQKKNK